MENIDFYNRNFKSIFRFFYYKINDVPRSEDLASEVFCIFYQKYNHLLESRKADSEKILFGIAKNIWKQYLSKKKYNFLSFGAFFGELEINPKQFLILKDLDTKSQNQDKENWKQSKNLELQKALKSLSPKLQTLIELRFSKGLTRKETAELMNLSQDMVHTYQKRAIKYLKKALNKQ